MAVDAHVDLLSNRFMSFLILVGGGDTYSESRDRHRYCKEKECEDLESGQDRRRQHVSANLEMASVTDEWEPGEGGLVS